MVNDACGLKLTPVATVPPLTGLIKAVACISLATGIIKLPSSAPISGVVAFLVSPSISVVIPETGVPALSTGVATAVLICRFVADIN